MPWEGRSDPLDQKALQTLKDDFKSDNADRRDEDLTKQQADSAIARAQKASRADPEDPEKLLTLAEAYGVLDPYDPRCFNVIDKLCRFVGAESLYAQRQGDAYLLYGRQLFLKDQLEESREYFEKARKLYYSDGTKRKRRDVNVGLLRVYAALGKSKEAAQRLEVALTLCEEKDDSVLMYMHAKNALEKNGVARDTEVLDDIWYVHLDTHPEDKARWSEFPTGDSVSQMLQQDEKEIDWREALHDAIFNMHPVLKEIIKFLSLGALVCFVMLIFLTITGGG